mgnify:CR=1 FL=1
MGTTRWNPDPLTRVDGEEEEARSECPVPWKYRFSLSNLVRIVGVSFVVVGSTGVSALVFIDIDSAFGASGMTGFVFSLPSYHPSNDTGLCIQYRLPHHIRQYPQRYLADSR